MYLISLYFDKKTKKRIQQYIDQTTRKTGNTFINVDNMIVINAFERFRFEFDTRK